MADERLRQLNICRYNYCSWWGLTPLNCSLRVLVAPWLLRPPSAREVIGSIPVRHFFLAHARRMSIITSFKFSFPSFCLVIYHLNNLCTILLVFFLPQWTIVWILRYFTPQIVTRHYHLYNKEYLHVWMLFHHSTPIDISWIEGLPLDAISGLPFLLFTFLLRLSSL